MINNRKINETLKNKKIIKIKIYINLRIYLQNIFKYMNELLIKTIIFKYFLKILKIKINYDFDFSKKITRNAFILSYFHMPSISSQALITILIFMV